MLVLLALSAAFTANAEIRFKTPFYDGVVLQQNSAVTIKGFAEPGQKLVVAPDWELPGQTTADEYGQWSYTCKTKEADFKNHKFTVRDIKKNEKAVLNDILFGEVWLASGQSNMEMPMHGWQGTPVEGGWDCIIEDNMPDGVRIFMGAAEFSSEEQEEYNGKWYKTEPGKFGPVGATAYFFARRLHRALGVPVGVVNMAYGGSSVVAWLSEEYARICGLDPKDPAFEQVWEGDRPSQMYNAMIHPVLGFPIKGFIWYQGCANVGGPQWYANNFKELTNCWRKKWNDKDNKLPFYAVEIAPYSYNDDDEGVNAALLRAAQKEGIALIENGGFIGTNDLVYPDERKQIHPRNKRVVGERLANLALHRDYGMDAIPCYCPEVVKGSAYIGNSPEVLIVSVVNCGDGLVSTDEIKGLSVAGADGVFHPADCVWEDGGYMFISSKEVKNPVEARYCWGNFVLGNLKAASGLPLLPFDEKVK